MFDKNADAGRHPQDRFSRSGMGWGWFLRICKHPDDSVLRIIILSSPGNVGSFWCLPLRGLPPPGSWDPSWAGITLAWFPRGIGGTRGRTPLLFPLLGRILLPSHFRPQQGSIRRVYRIPGDVPHHQPAWDVQEHRHTPTPALPVLRVSEHVLSTVFNPNLPLYPPLLPLLK